MKLGKIFFVMAIVFWIVPLAFAQTQNAPVVPEGMEEIQIGGSAKLIVPKGAKTRKVGAQIIVEGTKEYVARRISELDEQLKRIEKRQTEFQEELKMIKADIKKIQDNATLNKVDTKTAVPSP